MKSSNGSSTNRLSGQYQAIPPSNEIVSSDENFHLKLPSEKTDIGKSSNHTASSSSAWPSVM
jgi:hypothetical protein